MDAVELTQKLVRIDSCNPGSYEKAAGDFVYDYLKATGADVTRQSVFPDRNNIIACLPGETDEPALVYICHLDTVPIGDGWTRDPFEAAIEDGRIYGRGSCDMKSGMACCLKAFETIADQKKSRKRPFMMIASVDEEDCMKGVSALVESGIITKDMLVLDTEPTNLEIQVAHKGKTWFEIKAYGRAAHSSTSDKGIDAVAAIGEFISAVNRRVNELPVHKEMGPNAVTYGLIRGGTNFNIVPDSCNITIDFRVVPPVSNEQSIRLIDDAIKESEDKIKGVRFEKNVISQHPAIEKDDHSYLLLELKKAVKEITGRNPAVTFFPGYTDTAVVAAHTGNINCMSFGPGNLSMAHKPDEYVKCENIYICTEIVTKLAEDILYGA